MGTIAASPVGVLMRKTAARRGWGRNACGSELHAAGDTRTETVPSGVPNEGTRTNVHGHELLVQEGSTSRRRQPPAGLVPAGPWRRAKPVGQRKGHDQDFKSGGTRSSCTPPACRPAAKSCVELIARARVENAPAFASPVSGSATSRNLKTRSARRAGAGRPETKSDGAQEWRRKLEARTTVCNSTGSSLPPPPALLA
jgi:hypothetical protein